MRDGAYLISGKRRMRYPNSANFILTAQQFQPRFKKLFNLVFRDPIWLTKCLQLRLIRLKYFSEHPD